VPSPLDVPPPESQVQLMSHSLSHTGPSMASGGDDDDDDGGDGAKDAEAESNDGSDFHERAELRLRRRCTLCCVRCRDLTGLLHRFTSSCPACTSW
jgi:hypothetical protein